MKKAIFALSFSLSLLASPLFAQETPKAADAAGVSETAVKAETEAKADAVEEVKADAPFTFSIFGDSTTGCEPQVLNIFRLCGERFNHTVCKYDDLEISGGSRCEANYLSRLTVCKRDGKFDEAKLECSSSEDSILRRLR